MDRVIPSPGDEVLQQQRVAVVLDTRYRLSSLVIYPSEQSTGGVDVTAEVDHIEGLNRFEFVSGDGRLIEALSPDTNCAVARFVLIARPRGVRHRPLVLRGVLALRRPALHPITRTETGAGQSQGSIRRCWL